MFVKLTIEPLIGGLIPIETGRSVEKYIILSPIEPLIGGLIHVKFKHSPLRLYLIY